MPSLAPNFPASLLVFALLFLPALASASAPFSAQLDATDHAAAGLTKLSAEQRAALDAQIERELTVARQGNVVAFSRSFLQRRTSDQVAAAGLATLSPEERATLDRFVARAVAQRPAVLVPTLAARAKTSDDTVIETVTYKPQLHTQSTPTMLCIQLRNNRAHRALCSLTLVQHQPSGDNHERLPLVNGLCRPSGEPVSRGTEH